MAVEHLPASASPADVAALLGRDGCAIVDRLASRDAMARVRDELAPWIAATPTGDEFGGRSTRRTGGLVARSPASRDLVMNPLVVDTVKDVLAHASSFHLHVTQLISIEPGEKAQSVHRDQWAFDFFPFPADYEVQCNTIWAMTDFTAQNGGTRLMPGSHRFEDRLQFAEEDTEAAEMETGSVLLYTGRLYHGGGANRSDAVRRGINIAYAVSWLRQEENQYLSVPREIALALPDDLLRLLGYARGAYALGYVDDTRDPLDALRGRVPEGAQSFGDAELVKARARLKKTGSA
jgi:ectoine hydroxylase-related dioxygenase (phytanoyl-CoA dioxygenase family)